MLNNLCISVVGLALVGGVTTHPYAGGCNASTQRMPRCVVPASTITAALNEFATVEQTLESPRTP